MTGTAGRRARGFAIAAGVVAAAIVATLPAIAGDERWWSPGDDRLWPAQLDYANARGTIGVLRDGAPLRTKGHPFFEPLGANGRACVTCHQPADAMSLSAATAQERWRETQGPDPLFAAVDGSNCPHLPQDDPASHSLLLERGLIRISLPWPPRDATGAPIDPEFTIEVVRDPTGCNTHPEYGLTVAVADGLRLPAPAPGREHEVHDARELRRAAVHRQERAAASRDPDTGRASVMNLMADARSRRCACRRSTRRRRTCRCAAAADARSSTRIIAFEGSLRGAGRHARPAPRRTGRSARLGPQAMQRGEAGVLGNNTTRWVIPMDVKWQSLPRGVDPADRRAQRNARVDPARPRRLHVPHVLDPRLDAHQQRRPRQPDQAHLRDLPRHAHDGHGYANGWMDIGTTNLPWARETPQNPWNREAVEMPLFKVTCKAACRRTRSSAA
jgi:hypothetical protein